MAAERTRVVVGSKVVGCAYVGGQDFRACLGGSGPVLGVGVQDEKGDVVLVVGTHLVEDGVA